MNKLKKILLGLFILILGFFIGSQVVISIWKKHNTTLESLLRFRTNNKINALLQAVETKYVDVIDVDSLIDEALPVILRELDPHSAYYPPRRPSTAMMNCTAAFRE